MTGFSEFRNIVGRVRPVRIWILAGLFMMFFLCLIPGCGGRKRVGVDVSTDRTPWVTVPPGPVLVRVGLAEEQDSVKLEADGPCVLLADRDRNRIGRYAGPLIFSAHRRGSNISWSLGNSQGEATTIVLQPVDPTSRISWDGQLYRGDIILIPTASRSGLTVVNLVELERYLCGVVPWEIGRPERDALAALEAQAVAARTYTISHLGARQSLGFDVWASVMDQVYRGAADEYVLCNEAIANTAGLVLRSDGQEIEAFYSATCGGMTSDVAEVWPRQARPYLVSHPDADGKKDFCAGGRYYTWETSWTGEQLDTILARTLPEYLEYMGAEYRVAWAGTLFQPTSDQSDRLRPGRLRRLEIVDRTSSGRVGKLAVFTDAGVYYVRGDRVRWVLPPPDGNPFILRSANFVLDVSETAGRPAMVTARGRGYGHGIGMCQVGALAMARQGYSSVQILEHYYPGAVLEPISRDGK